MRSNCKSKGKCPEACEFHVPQQQFEHDDYDDQDKIPSLCKDW